METTELINSIPHKIKRVKDIYFSINEDLYIDEPGKMISIELNHTLGLSSDRKFINFTIGAFYHYDDAPLENKLAEIKVQNVFEFQDLSIYVDDKGILTLPTEILISIVNVSMSHVRALLAKNLAGTAFQEVILPLTSPLDVTKHFFGHLFPDQPAQFMKE